VTDGNLQQNGKGKWQRCVYLVYISKQKANIETTAHDDDDNTIHAQASWRATITHTVLLGHMICHDTNTHHQKCY
jgi:hypothetical protein